MFNLLMRIVFDVDEEYKVGSFLWCYLLTLGNYICWMDNDSTIASKFTLILLSSSCILYFVGLDFWFLWKFKKRPSILECKYEEMSDYFWGTVSSDGYRFMKTKLLISMVITILVYGITITSILLLIARSLR